MIRNRLDTNKAFEPTAYMKRKDILFLFILIGLILFNACANTGSPGGGPKDVTPPKFVKSIPLQDQLNYKKKRIEIYFDELVSLEKAFEKVIVSPPQKMSPTVSAVGNKVSVLLVDSLLPKTTYTIDFTDAIVDYNEGNKFGDYAFSFSTGDKIDSLRISGILIDASNLNPVPNVLIGVHTNLSDSSFAKIPFERISKTNQNGFFTVKGLPENRFHLYALGDKNRDFRFDQPGEPIAFNDSIIRPWTEPCQRTDTIWRDSITVDTVLVRNVTCFKPNDIVLRYFTEDFGRQYLSKKERPSRNRIELFFGTKSETLPSIKLLNSSISDWYLLEKNPTNDTLIYWISDKNVSLIDTIHLQIDYFKTDSLNKLSPATDTLKLVPQGFHPKQLSEGKSKKNKDTTAIKTVTPLDIRTDIQATMDIYSIPRIEWGMPIKEVKGSPWKLFEKKDSVWAQVPFSIQKDSLHLRDYLLHAKWKFGGTYRFDIDSGMVVGLYGETNDKFSQLFKIRDEEEYSRLTVILRGITGPSFVELLDKSDHVVRKNKVENNQVDFQYLMPESYYLRAIEDRNNNFIWDTGNYAEKRQPENVYYDPKVMNLRANWDVEEEWNVFEFPLLQQKPKELLPKNDKK